MRKKLLFLALLMFCVSNVGAVEKGVVITHANGSFTFLPLVKPIDCKVADGVTAVFSGEGISSLELGVSEIADIRIGENPSLGIGSMQQDVTKLSFDDFSIRVSNAAGQSATLHDMSGKTIGAFQANAQGIIVVPVSHFNSGVFVLSLSNGKTYKIQKR